MIVCQAVLRSSFLCVWVGGIPHLFSLVFFWVVPFRFMFVPRRFSWNFTVTYVKSSTGGGPNIRGRPNTKGMPNTRGTQGSGNFRGVPAKYKGHPLLLFWEPIFDSARQCQSSVGKKIGAKFECYFKKTRLRRAISLPTRCTRYFRFIRYEEGSSRE